MVKNILIKSPDEWTTTKQTCRDESVVYLFLSSTTYIHTHTHTHTHALYIYIYFFLYIYVYVVALVLIVFTLVPSRPSPFRKHMDRVEALFSSSGAKRLWEHPCMD